MSRRRVPYPKFPGGIGLHRTAAIARLLELDLSAFGLRGAVITGSNGKGSTAAMLASILRRQQSRVGLFTSPHLLALNERFQIDGEAIADDDLSVHWEAVARAVESWRAEGGEEISGFEFLFLIAARWFATQGCTYTVWEAGIGGRYDPVRLIGARELALVSLDLEHTALLGDTLELIAYDKLDAAPPGARVFLGDSCAPLKARIETYCGLRRVTPVLLGRDDLGAFAPPLAGAHQRNNTALAVALARALVPALDDAAIAAGLRATLWPGRLETLGEAPLIVIDVGHTPAGIRAALDGFMSLAEGRAAVLVCGASFDKDARGLVSVLAPGFQRIVCTAARHKGAPAREIAAFVAAAHPAAEITIAATVSEARAMALAQAGPAGAIYVAGGLFLAAEFKAAHQGLDPAALDFF